MPFRTREQLQRTYGRALEDLLNLPELAVDELRGGPEATRELVARSNPLRRPMITVPGLEDIFHIVPEQFLPEEEQAAERRRRFSLLRASPLPEIDRSLVRIITATDTIQNALVAGSVLARIAALAQPELVPVAVGLGEAADALNTLNIVAGAVSNPLQTKGAYKAVTRGAYGSAAARARAATTMASALPAVHETIEILHASDQLTGFGLSFGASLGFLPGAMFGIPQNAEFALPGRRRYRDLDELFARPELIPGAVTGTLDDIISDVLRAPAALSEIAGLSQPLPWSDHFEGLLTASLGAEFMRGHIAPANWLPFATPWFHRPEKPSAEPHLATRTLLAEARIDPLRPEPPAFSGAPLGATPAELYIPRARAITAGLGRVLREAPGPRERAYASLYASNLPYQLIRGFEGPSVRFEAHDAPHTRVVTDTLELGLLPPARSTEAQRKDYLQRATRLYTEPGDPIPIRGLREVFAAAYPKSATK